MKKSNLEIGSFLIRIVAVVLAITLVAFVSVVPQVANDFWLQAKVGEIVVRHGHIPRTLLFPFTEIQTQHFNAHEWLASVGFYCLLHVAGEASLPWVLGILGMGYFVTAATLAYRRGPRDLPCALLFGLLAVATENYRHFLRPELLSLLLFAAFLHALTCFQRSPTVKATSAALTLTVLWANIHGSFLLAPMVAMILGGGLLLDRLRARQPEAAQTLASSTAGFWNWTLLSVGLWLCTLINPFGWKQLAFVLEFSRSNFAQSYVQEWVSSLNPVVRNWRGFWIAAFSSTFTAVIVCLRWRRLRMGEAMLLVVFTLLAIKAARFWVYLGLIAAYVLPPLIPGSWCVQSLQVRRYALCALTSVCLLCATIRFGNAFGAYPHTSDINQSFSAPMLQALNDPRLHGNVLTTYDYGAELVYRAYPRLRPSLDSRIDSYGETYIQSTEALLHDDKLLRDFVTRYDVSYMLLTYGDFYLIQALDSWQQGAWTIELADTRAILLSRKDPR